MHLPQYGRAASGEAMARAARHAEALGFADVWVSDHIVQPVGQDYPSPFPIDPLLSLAFASAVTSTIGLGTSVLVLPQHQPLPLADALASLDQLSGGRVIVGAGVGWSAGEFAVSFEGGFYRFAELRVLPKPAHPIPIWVGGMADAGVQHVVSAPWRNTLDDWLRSLDLLADLVLR